VKLTRPGPPPSTDQATPSVTTASTSTVNDPSAARWRGWPGPQRRCSRSLETTSSQAPISPVTGAPAHATACHPAWGVPTGSNSPQAMPSSRSAGAQLPWPGSSPRWRRARPRAASRGDSPSCRAPVSAASVPDRSRRRLPAASAGRPAQTWSRRRSAKPAVAEVRATVFAQLRAPNTAECVTGHTLPAATRGSARARPSILAAHRPCLRGRVRINSPTRRA